MKAPTEVTRSVCRRYFEAWTSGDTAATASLLAADFRFTAGDLHVSGRDAFLDAGAFPADASTAMLAEAYDGDIGFQLYEATRGPSSVRVAEQLEVVDGRIRSSTFVTDPVAFGALFAR